LPQRPGFPYAQMIFPAINFIRYRLGVWVGLMACHEALVRRYTFHIYCYRNTRASSCTNKEFYLVFHPFIGPTVVVSRGWRRDT
jgi:hypothetical protein